jgi:hypothetical protein
MLCGIPDGELSNLFLFFSLTNPLVGRLSFRKIRSPGEFEGGWMSRVYAAKEVQHIDRS